MEISTPVERDHLLGTVQYTAPEYLVGESGTPRSDLYSLGVIAYEMLTGKIPYGDHVAKATTKAVQKKLKYISLQGDEREIPVWINGVLKKAVHPDPHKRYEELSEFMFDLRHSNKEFLNEKKPPLLERDPLFFWKSFAFIEAVIIAALLIKLF